MGFGGSPPRFSGIDLVITMSCDGRHVVICTISFLNAKLTNIALMTCE